MKTEALIELAKNYAHALGWVYYRLSVETIPVTYGAAVSVRHFITAKDRVYFFINDTPETPSQQSATVANYLTIQSDENFEKWEQNNLTSPVTYVSRQRTGIDHTGNIEVKIVASGAPDLIELPVLILEPITRFVDLSKN